MIHNFHNFRQIEGAIEGLAYLHSGEALFVGSFEPDPTRKYKFSHGDLKPVSAEVL